MSRHAFTRVWWDALARRHCPAAFAEPFWRLVNAARISSALLRAPAVPNRTCTHNAERLLVAFARMSVQAGRWVAAPESFCAPAASERRQFRALAGHLFSPYPLPAVVADLWLRRDLADWQRQLFLHVAAGKSIRRFLHPVTRRLTKAAAAQFMIAPEDLSLEQALRWAEVRALGGEATLARDLAARTNFGALEEQHEVCGSMLRFFVRQQPVEREELQAIVTFVRQQRLTPARELLGAPYGEEPLQPQFALDGRTLRSLRRTMNEWRSEVPPPPVPRQELIWQTIVRAPGQPRSQAPQPWSASWPASEIGPLRYQERSILWTIDEILTAAELREEGAAMQHCVASYVHRCAERATTIWSLRRTSHTLVAERVLTIEVSPRIRRIVQAKGHRNATPLPEQLALVHLWAREQGLVV